MTTTTKTDDVTISRTHLALLMGLARRHAHALRDRLLMERAKNALRLPRSGQASPQDAKILKIRDGACDSAFDILKAAEIASGLRWDSESATYTTEAQGVV